MNYEAMLKDIKRMEERKLISRGGLSETEFLQRWAKILVNSCYGGFTATTEFKLYEVNQ